MPTGTSGGWNKPQQTPKPAPKKPTALRGLIAGAVVVLVALGAVYFFMFGNEPKVEIKESTKPRRIKEVTPAPVTNKVEVAQPVEEPVEMYRGQKVVSHTYKTNDNGRVIREIIRTADGKSHGKTTVINDPPFENTSDAMIADLLFPHIEGGLAPLPPLDAGALDRQFKASLKKPLEIKETDSEELAAKKMAVMQARAEIKKIMKEDNCTLLDIINNERAALVQSRQMQLEVLRGLQQVRKDGGSFGDEMRFLRQANRLLEEKGIAPVEYKAPEGRPVHTQPNNQEGTEE